MAHADVNDEFMRELLKEEHRLEEERILESVHQYDNCYVHEQEEQWKHKEQVCQAEAFAGITRTHIGRTTRADIKKSRGRYRLLRCNQPIRSVPKGQADVQCL